MIFEKKPFELVWLHQGTYLLVKFKKFEMVKLSLATYLGEKCEDFSKW
jgi:hypothetical protein